MDSLQSFLSRSSFSFSSYQKDIFSFAANGTENAMVSATAGSGKTTTLLKLAELLYSLDSNFNIAFLAFNKRIAQEIGAKYKGNKPVHFSTFHSLGMKLLTGSGMRRFWKIQEVQYWKFADFFQNNSITKVFKGMDGKDCRIAKQIQSELMAIASLCKNCMIDWTNQQELVKACLHYGISYSEESLSMIESFMAFDENQSARGIIIFDDMLYLPVKYKILPRLNFSHILIDEAQDSNEVQKHFICLFNNCRVFAVGDKAQALYGFRGSNTQAINDLCQHFSMKELPLSISYRCPVSHIRLAQGYCHTIEASENAREGTIEEGLNSTNFIETLKDGDLVICRTNQPLLTYALQLIAKGQKAIILGLELGNNIINLVKSFDAISVDEALNKLVSWREKASESAQKRGEKSNYVEDLESCTRMLLESCQTIAEFEAKVSKIFSKDRSGVTFSTVHKAKGLENNRVIYLKDDFTPPKDSPEWVAEQLNNLHFVAVTRSTNYLAIVPIETAKRKGKADKEEKEGEEWEEEGEEEAFEIEAMQE